MESDYFWISFALRGIRRRLQGSMNTFDLDLDLWSDLLRWNKLKLAPFSIINGMSLRKQNGVILHFSQTSLLNLKAIQEAINSFF
jgi:hypothetical protein